jgi:LysR family transcriptional regulator, regulator for metE and metH
MELKHLRLVKNIVDLGSMAKSKHKLCLTQSALSHQLKEAENQAGTALFYRRNKKLILTPAGALVYKSATDILDRTDRLEQEVRDMAKTGKYLMRICTACFTNYLWMPSLIARFDEMHPGVEIKICPEYLNQGVERILSHDLDALIVNKPEPVKGIRYFEIMNDELVAIVPPGHKWLKKKYVKATDFADCNLIIFSKPMHTVVVYNRVMKPAGISPRIIYEVPMTEAMVEMVVSGLGIAVIPYWIAQPYIEPGRVTAVRVTRGGLHRSLGIVFHERETYPPYYHTLVEFFRQNLSQFKPRDQLVSGQFHDEYPVLRKD